MVKVIKNLAIIIALVVALVLLTFYLIGVYTGDNETNIEVPTVVEMRIDKAKKALEEKGLRYEIIDSVYSNAYKRMAVTEQDPAAGSQVKTDRKIYLIINSMSKPQVKMPKLVNKSFNLAKVLIKNSGLKLGEITETYSELGDGFVIEQTHKGKPIEMNAMIEKGSTIDLLVSKNSKDEEVLEDGETNLKPAEPIDGIDANN